MAKRVGSGGCIMLYGDLVLTIFLFLSKKISVNFFKIYMVTRLHISDGGDYEPSARAAKTTNLRQERTAETNLLAFEVLYRAFIDI